MAHLRSFWKQILFLEIYAIMQKNGRGGLKLNIFKIIRSNCNIKKIKSTRTPESLHGNPRLWRT